MFVLLPKKTGSHYSQTLTCLTGLINALHPVTVAKSSAVRFLFCDLCLEQMNFENAGEWLPEPSLVLTPSGKNKALVGDVDFQTTGVVRINVTYKQKSIRRPLD